MARGIRSRRPDEKKNLVAPKTYHHSVVEADLCIHIHWESEKESQRERSLGPEIFFCLKAVGAGESFSMV